MALDTFIAGRYSSTYATADTGITEQGFEVQLDTDFEDVGETDAYGTSVIDGVWRGGNCWIEFLSKAFKAGSLGAFWPYGGPLAGPGVLGILVDPTQGTPLPIGQLASNIAKTHVLSVTAGTPAQNATPSINSLTANAALLAKGYNAKLLFNSKLRNVPVRLRYYPFLSASIVKFFTTA